MTYTAFMAAATARALVLSLAAVCLPVFSNIPHSKLFAEKPHLGIDNFASVSHPVESSSNVLIAPGFDGCLYDSSTGPCSTGKERDSETGLDYFGARYLSSAQGRFTSTDPGGFGASPSDPQSWNMYSYGLNNPLRYTDPDGLAVNVCLNDDKGKTTCTLVSDADYAKSREGNPGIVAPPTGGRTGLGGVITCGGIECGHTSYVEEGMVDVTGDVVAVASLPSAIRGGVSLGQGVGRGLSRFLKRETPSASKAGASAVENLKNLSGVGRSEAREALKEAGFQDRGVSQGGYEKWYHPDGSRVQIRPNGEVLGQVHESGLLMGAKSMPRASAQTGGGLLHPTPTALGKS